MTDIPKTTTAHDGDLAAMPTEVEIADAIWALETLGVRPAALTVRRLAFHRDRLASASRRADAAEKALAMHGQCHNLDGSVSARQFADGCSAEQRRLYGCAPDADRLTAAEADAGRLRKAARAVVEADREPGSPEHQDAMLELEKSLAGTEGETNSPATNPNRRP